MKPLLATKVQRVDSGAAPVREWESAEHHLTHDGQHDFHARMLARIKAAQTKPEARNVAPITQRKAK